MTEKKQSMSPGAAARIQSAVAKVGGDTSEGSFPAIAQAAAAANVNAAAAGDKAKTPKSSELDGKSGDGNAAGTPTEEK